MTRSLITGANKGIGLEHTKQALATGNYVIATCRSPKQAIELQKLGDKYPKQLTIETLDLSVFESAETLAKRLKNCPIDILLNVGGVFGGSFSNKDDLNKQTLLNMDYAQWFNILQINVLGNFKLIAQLLPNIEAGNKKQIIMMSSDLGSIANNTHGLSHAYSSSKAALNMITKGLSVELADKEITIISLAPGWVKTALGGSNAHWEVEESVSLQRKVIDSLKLSDSGRFINLLGETVSW